MGDKRSNKPTTIKHTVLKTNKPTFVYNAVATALYFLPIYDELISLAYSGDYKRKLINDNACS
jgi:hypothetical protein